MDATWLELMANIAARAIQHIGFREIVRHVLYQMELLMASSVINTMVEVVRDGFISGHGFCNYKYIVSIIGMQLLPLELLFLFSD